MGKPLMEIHLMNLYTWKIFVKLLTIIFNSLSPLKELGPREDVESDGWNFQQDLPKVNSPNIWVQRAIISSLNLKKV